MLLRRPGKEPLGGGHITPFAQEEIDGATLFVHGACDLLFLRGSVNDPTDSRTEKSAPNDSILFSLTAGPLLYPASEFRHPDR
jgi:hypothetical protein